MTGNIHILVNEKKRIFMIAKKDDLKVAATLQI